jgi:4-oxalocrotonate tautomerase
MPVVEVKLTAGRTDQQKERIIAGITEVLVDTLNVRPDQVTVLLYDIPKQHWGLQGKPLTSLSL